MNDTTPDKLLEMSRGFQPACVLMAAAELDLFSLLNEGPFSAAEISKKIGADLRAMTLLLDALCALSILTKDRQKYRVPYSLADLLSSESPQSVVPMLQHLANCARRWVRLAEVVKSGKPTERIASVRGEEGDRESFIHAMHAISQATAPALIAELKETTFKHLLDIGGASGTWTVAFLAENPGANATLFDLPHVIPLAAKRLQGTPYEKRVRFISGDFYQDELPAGADLAWLGAIAHQNSRAQNRTLFAKVFRALEPGGRLIIRDVVMEDNHVNPLGGALFAINMLVGTEAGGTYSLREYTEDLEGSGFTEVRLIRQDENMNSLIQAKKQARIP